MRGPAVEEEVEEEEEEGEGEGRIQTCLLTHNSDSAAVAMMAAG
jgi:hypothetical protein